MPCKGHTAACSLRTSTDQQARNITSASLLHIVHEGCLLCQDRVTELHKSKTELEAQTDVARSAANQALRDKERAVHERGIQEQKAAFLEAEVGRTSAALQQERRSHAAEVRGHSLHQVAGSAQRHSWRLPSHNVRSHRLHPIECCTSGLRVAAQLRQLQVQLHDAEAAAAEKEAAAGRAAERAEAQEAAAADLLQQLRQTKQDAAEIREALERELETTSRLVSWQQGLQWVWVWVRGLD